MADDLRSDTGCMAQFFISRRVAIRHRTDFDRWVTGTVDGFDGDPLDVAEAHAAVRSGFDVEMPNGEWVRASLDGFPGIAAALMCAIPGGVITEAPASLKKYLTTTERETV